MEQIHFAGKFQLNLCSDQAMAIWELRLVAYSSPYSSIRWNRFTSLGSSNWIYALIKLWPYGSYDWSLTVRLTVVSDGTDSLRQFELTSGNFQLYFRSDYINVHLGILCSGVPPCTRIRWNKFTLLIWATHVGVPPAFIIHPVILCWAVLDSSDGTKSPCFPARSKKSFRWV